MENTAPSQGKPQQGLPVVCFVHHRDIIVQRPLEAGGCSANQKARKDNHWRMCFLVNRNFSVCRNITEYSWLKRTHKDRVQLPPCTGHPQNSTMCLTVLIVPECSRAGTAAAKALNLSSRTQSQQTAVRCSHTPTMQVGTTGWRTRKARKTKN